MKTTKLIIAMASMMLLASCGGNTPASTSSASSEPSSSSQAKKTMDFLKDGQFYAYVPNDVLQTTTGEILKIKVNGTSIAGSTTLDIGAKIELAAEGNFQHDVYVVIAKSESEGHISARIYGALEKETLNEGLSTVADAIGTPNKLYISFTTQKNTWFKELDAEMDQEIEAAWGLLAD